MQEQINNLQRQIEDLLDWKFQKERQQISFPIDQTSLSIVNKDNGKIAVNGIYLSIDSTNPATSLGYGTWTAVGNGKLLQGITAGSGGGSNNITATTGVGVIATTYTTYIWLRIA